MSNNDEDYWKRNGLKPGHIIPDVGSEFPEGFDVRKFLREITPDIMVTELGCGYGRLCEAFEPDKYLGIDINPSAVQKATIDHPQYTFKTIAGAYPSSELYMAYTVFIHISDDNLIKILPKLNSKYILIGEILGYEWRNPNQTIPVYNRDIKWYDDHLGRLGYKREFEKRKPYERYKIQNTNKNTDVSFLLYSR